MTEASTLRAILVYLGSRFDVVAWRSQSIAARAADGRMIRALPKGHPDICGIISVGPGLAAPLYIEVKSEAGRVSLEQRRFAAMLVAHNACYVLARSPADVEEAIGEYRLAHMHRLQAIAHGGQVREDASTLP